MFSQILCLIDKNIPLKYKNYIVKKHAAREIFKILEKFHL